MSKPPKLSIVETNLLFDLYNLYKKEGTDSFLIGCPECGQLKVQQDGKVDTSTCLHALCPFEKENVEN